MTSQLHDNMQLLMKVIKITKIYSFLSSFLLWKRRAQPRNLKLIELLL